MKYRKQPVEVEAFKFGFDPMPDWFYDAITENGVRLNINKTRDPFEAATTGSCFIDTLEGYIKASFGDMIIQGVKGEIYPCNPDIFEMTYEPV